MQENSQHGKVPHIFPPSRLTHMLTALRAPRIYPVNAMSVLELLCVKLPYIGNISVPFFSLKLECHSNWNVIRIEMSLKLECHENWNVTQF